MTDQVTYEVVLSVLMLWYHYHSGLVFIFLKTTGPPNVLDMITALFDINIQVS